MDSSSSWGLGRWCYDGLEMWVGNVGWYQPVKRGHSIIFFSNVALYVFCIPHFHFPLTLSGESLLFRKLTPWRHSAHLSGESTSRRDIINYFRQYAAAPRSFELSNLAIIPSVLANVGQRRPNKYTGASVELSWVEWSSNAKTSITNPR